MVKPIMLLVLFVAVCGLFWGKPSCAADFPGSAHVLEGVATTKDGRPLAHARLFLLDLPPGQSWGTTLGDDTTVVTDDRGHFTWHVPADVVLLPDSGESAPECWALAADAGWRYSFRFRPGNNADFESRQLMEDTARVCDTGWVRKGTSPIISVVAPDMGRVVTVVRGPDGKPLRDRAVQVFATDDNLASFGSVAEYEGKTDAAGHLNTRWFTGLLRMQVLAPGVGFASTGTFQILPGQEAVAEVPPLVPFCRLSGVVVPARPGSRVELDDDAFPGSRWSWYRPSAVVDAHGHWALTDVLPGPQRVVWSGAAGETADDQVTVEAGEAVDDLRLVPKQVTPPAPSSRRAAPQAAEVAAHGTVTDTAGHPVAGATVAAVGSVYGQFHTYQAGRKATTDAAGRYTLPALTTGSGGGNPLLLVAVRSGYAPAEASTHFWADTPGEDVPVDLVLPPLTTGLSVRVLRDGRPLAEATVRLVRQGGVGLSERSSAAGALPDAVDAALAPTAATGPDGRAFFAGLAPGLWDVVATSGKDAYALTRVMESLGGQADAVGLARGVAVRAGAVADFALSIYPQPGNISFRVRGPGGMPPTDPGIALGFGSAVSPYSASTSLTLDPLGIGTYVLAQPGLWRVSTFFRDVAVRSFPVTAEPYYSGDALFAVSASTPEPGPATIHASRHGPGRIRVRLKNAAGHAARGAVRIEPAFDGSQVGASVDSRGEALLPEMTSGDYTLTAHVLGSPRLPSLGRAGEPLPSDAVLSGVRLVLPQTVTVHADRETAVTFRPQPQEYVRGVLRVPGRLADYALYPDTIASVLPAIRLDPATGEFVAGPFPPGPVVMTLSRASSTEGAVPSQWQAKIDAVPGKVVSVTLAPKGDGVSPASRVTVMLPVGEFSYDWKMPLLGSVFLPDGVTPAWGARVALLAPQMRGPVTMARADAAGRLTQDDAWSREDAGKGVPPDSLAAPVLVAWLPGANGGAVVPYTPGQAARFVLPQAISARGKVTVGGRSVAGMNASFHIVASCRGRGTLDPLLSVDTTAQADGSFLLAGLTPGTYRVQAARDGIWLSPVQTLTVGSGPVPDLALDIPGAGRAVDLHLMDRDGKPLPGALVTVERPEGPLTDELWPKTLTADGTGSLHLEGLEAGQESLTVSAARDETAPAPTVPAKPLGTFRLDVSSFTPGAPPQEQAVRVVGSG